MSLIQKRIFIETSKKGITPADIAKILNVSNGVVSNWKRRDCDPKAEQIAIICNKFNLNINFIMLGEETQTTGLTQEEQQLLELFRSSTNDGRDTILKIAKLTEKKENNITDATDKFNKSDDEELKPFA